MRFCFFFVKRFKLLIEGGADLDDRKVFHRFPPVPTFVLHIGKINLTWNKNPKQFLIIL